MTDRQDETEMTREQLEQLRQVVFNDLAGQAEKLADQSPLPRAYLGRAYVGAGLVLMRDDAGDGMTADYLQAMVNELRAEKSVN